MALNFNATTPAAPSGSTNVTWQNDASGNVSAYVASTGGINPVNATGATDNITAATATTPTTAGLYRVTAYMIVTSPDAVSSTLPALTISWTDWDNTTPQSFVLLPTNNGNTTVTFQEDSMVVSSTSAVPIQYATSGYASNTPNSMAYALHIRIEAM
jgi:hypothetical protein